jgi:hypothetical protein
VSTPTIGVAWKSTSVPRIEMVTAFWPALYAGSTTTVEFSWIGSSVTACPPATL